MRIPDLSDEQFVTQSSRNFYKFIKMFLVLSQIRVFQVFLSSFFKLLFYIVLIADLQDK